MNSSNSAQPQPKPAFTKSQLVFFARMKFHMEKGLSFDDAARAVIADDERIRKILFASDERAERLRRAIAMPMWADAQQANIAREAKFYVTDQD